MPSMLIRSIVVSVDRAEVVVTMSESSAKPDVPMTESVETLYAVTLPFPEKTLRTTTLDDLANEAMNRLP